VGEEAVVMGSLLERLEQRETAARTPPYNPNGIRYGTPAATTRGMGPAQMRQVAGWTERVLRHLDDTAAQVEIREQVAKLHADFPIPR
jgi:glycine hydroxymethyltransferase